MIVHHRRDQLSMAGQEEEFPDRLNPSIGPRTWLFLAFSAKALATPSFRNVYRIPIHAQVLYWQADWLPSSTVCHARGSILIRLAMKGPSRIYVSINMLDLIIYKRHYHQMALWPLVRIPLVIIQPYQKVSPYLQYSPPWWTRERSTGGTSWYYIFVPV